MIGVGDRIEVVARRVAHGGAMLASIPADEERRTVFVRHALPGEQGTAVVTAVRSNGKLLFADLVDVQLASADRVSPPCSASGPGGCGGCDFQHVSLPAQRELKADVVRDCLRRIAHVDPAEVPWDQLVHAVPGDQDGLRWRTRSRFSVSNGELAMQGRRSTDLIPIKDCLIATQPMVAAAREAIGIGSVGELTAVASGTGEVLAGPTSHMRDRIVAEDVGDRRLRVGATGFWQAHPGAPAALLAAVNAVLAPQPGDVLVDLYAGVGLFAAGLEAQVTGGAIHLVEGDRAAARQARQNVAGTSGCRVHHRPVEQWLRTFAGPVDLVILDPPRTGAGAAVLGELHRLQPRKVAYVACDPAALARDLRILLDLGWRLTSLASFDLFPMTHHIESVAGLVPPA